MIALDLMYSGTYNKTEIPGQTVCYKQEFAISEQFPMRYCSTWLRSLLCYIKKFVIEEFVIRVFHCIYKYTSCSKDDTCTPNNMPINIHKIISVSVHVSKTHVHSQKYEYT